MSIGFFFLMFLPIWMKNSHFHRYFFVPRLQNIAVKIDPLPVSQVDNGGGGEERLLQQLADESQDVVELENIGDSTTSLNIDEGSVEPKRRWIRKPLNKRVKRLKQNRRLRKLLIPKNALMSLHELMGCQLSDYRIIPEERGFVAQISVNNIQYEGHGEYSIDFNR